MKYREFPDAYFLSNKERKLPSPAEIDKNISAVRRPLALFIKNLPQGARILDAGCGAGKVSYMVKAYRPDIEIHAVDISDVESILDDWIRFKKSSVEDVSKIYPPEYFDAIICLHVIEHLVFPMDMVDAYKTILKKGGKVFLETPNWTRLFIPFSPNFFWNDYTHIRPFSRFSINKLLTEFGFTPEIITTKSSLGFLVKGDITEAVSKIKDASSSNKKQFSLKSRWRIVEIFKIIFRRISGPFLRDVLIAVAVKQEK